MNNTESLRYFIPEVFLSVSILALLLLGFVGRRPEKMPVMMFGIASCVIGLGLEMALHHNISDNRSLVLFHGILRIDSLSHIFKSICLLSSIFLLFLSLNSRETMRRLTHAPEYVLLILTNTLGMMLLAASSHLLSMYLAIEFISLTSYLLTGFIDQDERSSEAAMKYILYGGVATGVMAYGLSLLYGMTGAMDYAGLARSIGDASGGGVVLYLSVFMILAGMGFKIAAVPFHSWCPDVYEGAATPIAAFLSVGPKAAGFALVLRFFYSIFATGQETPHPDWTTILAVISALTMTLGNIAALRQKNIKRMLAYSSIAHAGYILMAVASGTAFGAGAVFFYVAVYFLMNFGAFLVVIAVSNELNSDAIEDYEGLAWKGKVGAFLATCLAVFLFSLTGVPPFAGFIGKLYLLLSVFERGGTLYWLAGVAVINTVISFGYYAAVLKAMFLSRSHKGPGLGEMDPARYVSFSVIACLALLTILLGVYWKPLAALVD